MSYNHHGLILSIDVMEEATSCSCCSPRFPKRFPRPRAASDPCLPERLPSSGFIEREAKEIAVAALRKQLRMGSSSPQDPIEEAEIKDDRDHNPSSPASFSALSSSPVMSRVMTLIGGQESRLKRQPISKHVEPWQVFRAVERGDSTFLMQVRDKDFQHLLLGREYGTPLVHAIRIGRQDMAIVLLGAFSRYVNGLEEPDFKEPEIQKTLKLIRDNIQLAINEGLARSQTDLIASFLQVLVMSEGEDWLQRQIKAITRELQDPITGAPVKLADAVVRSFTTYNLKKAGIIAPLEDYIANATSDLLMLSAWSVALRSVNGKPIPYYFFARDDRIYKVFIENLWKHQDEIRNNCRRRFQNQLKVLTHTLQGRTMALHQKVEVLQKELDSTPVAVHLSPQD